MSLDETKLRDALRSIHGGQLSRAEAAAIVDVARLAASADGRMDLGEMGAIASLSRVVYSMAGGDDVPVPSKVLDPGALMQIGQQLEAMGPRELAYSCAMLVMHTDQKLTKEEGELGSKLAEALVLEQARARELDALMVALVR